MAYTLSVFFLPLMGLSGLMGGNGKYEYTPSVNDRTWAISEEAKVGGSLPPYCDKLHVE